MDVFILNVALSENSVEISTGLLWVFFSIFDGHGTGPYTPFSDKANFDYQLVKSHLGMDQYLLIPFLMG